MLRKQSAYALAELPGFCFRHRCGPAKLNIALRALQSFVRVATQEQLAPKAVTLPPAAHKMRPRLGKLKTCQTV